MYQITKGTTTVGYAECPNYVTKMSNGDFALVSEAEATGVSFNGTVYAIEGREAEGEGLDVVKLIEIDGGARLNEQDAQLKAADEALALMENAVCEQDAATDARLTDIELALCELDERTHNI